MSYILDVYNTLLEITILCRDPIFFQIYYIVSEYGTLHTPENNSQRKVNLQYDGYMYLYYMISWKRRNINLRTYKYLNLSR